MMKMKVIELLNKIANGEEVPKKIEYDNIGYYWCNACKIYERISDGSKDLYNDIDDLNDEVEIIEEEKNKINRLEMAIYTDNELKYIKVPKSKITKDIENKTNEIIDFLKSKGE